MLCCLSFTFGFTACKPDAKETGQRIIDIQGHRGARGLAPENTVAGFIIALQSGATTLEMDLVVSAEHQLVVSHEPWMDASICMTPEGNRIEVSEHESYNIYEMSYSEIMRFDCGRLGNERFYEQNRISVFKPLFIDAIMEIQQYSEENGLEYVHFNIELKSQDEWEGRFHPSTEEYAELLLHELYSLPIEERYNVQSFDIRALQYIHHSNPDIPLSLLVDNTENVERKIEQLGFVPDILSPHYSLIDAQLLKYCKTHNMQVIPWTVNDRETMQKLLDMGINSIITDYPNILTELVRMNEGMEIRNLMSY